MKTQNGFTLVELVMVIVILGVLSAVAVPRFLDLRETARTEATNAYAGQITSASAVNYAGRLVDDSQGATTAEITCEAAAEAVLQSALSEDFTYLGDGGVALAETSATSGAATICVLTRVDDSNITANYTIISSN